MSRCIYKRLKEGLRWERGGCFVSVLHLIDFPGDSSLNVYAIADGKKKRKILALHFMKSIVDLHTAT